MITTEVTERDKRLLVFLAAFLIVAGFGWFLIRPSCEKISKLKTDIAFAQVRQKQADYNISHINENRKRLSESAEQLQSEAKDFYPVMKSQQIDSVLTQKALSAGFAKEELRELSIAAVKKNVQLKGYLCKDEKSAGSSSENDEKASGICTAEVTFVLSGSRAKLESFLDTLANGDRSIRITGFSWVTSDTASNTSLLTLNLQIVMSDAQNTAEQVNKLIREEP